MALTTAERVKAFRQKARDQGRTQRSVYLPKGEPSPTSEELDYLLRRRNAAQIKLYICGQIAGDENYQQKFQDAEMKLREAGYTDIVNPVRLVPVGTPWEEAMRICLKAVLDCDGIALLPDWKASRGASLEFTVANELGMEVDTLWLWGQKVENAQKVWW
jgi:hypothetical protein